MIVQPALQWRAPNPPSSLLGREDELASLDHMMDRGEPLIIVAGAPGVGKTGLVTSWLKTRQHEVWRQRTLYIQCHTVPTYEALCAYILRAFSDFDASGADSVPLIEQPEKAVTLMIDLADRFDLFVILDDVGGVPREAIVKLTSMLTGYARQARWCLIGAELYPSLMRHTLHVKPLASPVLSQLIKQWVMPAMTSPSFDAHALLDYFTAEESGSLWQLEQALWGQASRPHSAALSITEAHQDALGLIALHNRPTPRALLTKELNVEPNVIQELLDARHIQAMPAGLVLTSRTGTETSHLSEARAHTLIDALCNSPHMGSIIEAARLCIAYRCYDHLERVLGAHFDLLRRHGYLTDLYGYLLNAADPKLDSWMFRCACFMTDFARAQQLRRDEELGLEDTLYWLYLLSAKGQYEELFELAERTYQTHKGDGKETQELLAQLHMTCARAYLAMGKPKEALASLDLMQSHDDWVWMRQSFVRLVCLTHDDRMAQATVILHELRPKFESFGRAKQRYWCMFMIHAYYRLKRYTDAVELANRFFDDPNYPTLIKGTEWILLGALWADTGHFKRAQRAVNHGLHNFVNVPSMRSMLLNIQLASALAHGDEALMRESHRDFAALPIEHVSVDSRADHEALLFQVNLLLQSQLVGHVVEQAASSVHARPIMHAMCTVDALRRHGSCTETRLDHSDNLELEMYHGIVDATRAIVTQTPCEYDIRALVARTSSHHMRRIELELRYMLCLHTLCFAPHHLHADVLGLRQLAEYTQSSRFMQEANWLTYLYGDQHDAQGLGALLETMQHASNGQMIVEAILDERDYSDLDAMNQVIVRHVKELVPWRCEVIASSEHESRWNLDMHTPKVWTYRDGALVEFEVAQHLIPFRLICALAHARGELCKEELVLRVWQDVEEYHPLHHDNRLRIAVRKLRKALVEALGDQPWITTTSEGYACGVPLRVWHAAYVQ